MKKISLAVSLVLSICLFGPIFAAAATPVEDSPPVTLPYGAIPAGLSSCFDYYSFGSTPIMVSGSLAAVSQGSVIVFNGTVTNRNKHPIVGATIYVKIFKFDADSRKKNVNGPYQVDFFPAATGLTLKAGESTPFSFNWNTPGDAEPGSYEAAFYVVQDNRFELLGLVFTNDIVGATSDFLVVGAKMGVTQFDKDKVTVNGKPYHFAAFVPSIPKGQVDVPISANVTNTAGTAFSSKISWKLYYWDASRASALLAESTAPVTVGPHATSTVSYTVSDTSHSVYYLHGEFMTPNGSKSIIDIRFNRADVFEPRLNDVGVTAYPLSQGTLAYACFHSSGAGEAAGVQVDLSVTAPGLFGSLFPSTIAQKTYQGIAPGRLVALAVPMSAAATSFVVHATISQNGKQLDSVDIPYSCSDLGAPCQSPLIPVASALAVIVALILLYLFFVRGKHSTMPPPPQIPPPTP
jgi:hypothetical protein